MFCRKIHIKIPTKLKNTRTGILTKVRISSKVRGWPPFLRLRFSHLLRFKGFHLSFPKTGLNTSLGAHDDPLDPTIKHKTKVFNTDVLTKVLVLSYHLRGLTHKDCSPEAPSPSLKGLSPVIQRF